MNRFKMKTRFYRYKWLFAVVALLGGLFLFAVNPLPAEAVPAPKCTYKYSANGKSIVRSQCASGFENGTLKQVDCDLADKCFTFTDSHKCVQNILIRDESKPNDAELTGEVYTNGKCENIDAGTVIDFTEGSPDTPEEILKQALKGLIDGRCGGLPNGSTEQNACYNDYYGWMEECNIRALDKAADTSGDKNVEYRNTFGQCMENKSGGKLVKLQVYQALPSNVYDLIIATQNGPGGEGDDNKTCESEGGAQAWMFCPLLMTLDGGIGWLSGQIDKLLEVDESKYTNTSLVNGWRGMRNIALIILIPMMLFMVIGTALNFGPFDAYTVKKALPRMMVAVLFIVLSLEITQFFVNVSNVVGRGVEGLLLAVSGSPDSLTDLYSAGGGFLFTSMLFMGGGAAILTGAVTLGIVGSLALSAFVALLVGYLILVIRELLVLVMMMVAPLAILVWIFPGNDKLWKIWRFTFTTLLLMFPLIALLITSGKVFANIIDGTENDFTAFFLKIVAFIAPFFLIPMTFKYSLGVFGNIAGMINDRSRGFFDRQKKYRGEARANARQQAKMGNRFAGGNKENWRGSLNKRIGQGLNAPGAIMASGSANPLKPSNYKKWGSAINTTMQDNEANDIENQLKENRTLPSWVFNDELAYAATNANNDIQTRENLAAAGYSGQALEDAALRIETSRRSMNAETFKQLTAKMALAGGTAIKGVQIKRKLPDGTEQVVAENIDAGLMWATVARAAGNNDAAAQALVAQGRNDLIKAGRPEAVAGFGTNMGIVDEMRAELRQTGTISLDTIQRASKKIHAEALDSKAAGSILYQDVKPEAVNQLAPTMLSNITDKVGDDRAFVKSIAHNSALYDAMNSTSPNKARIMDEKVMSQTIDTSALSETMRAALAPGIENGQITIQRATELLRRNEYFVQTRREYGSSIEGQLRAGEVQAAADQERQQNQEQ